MYEKYENNRPVIFINMMVRTWIPTSQLLYALLAIHMHTRCIYTDVQYIYEEISRQPQQINAKVETIHLTILHKIFYILILRFELSLYRGLLNNIQLYFLQLDTTRVPTKKRLAFPLGNTSTRLITPALAYTWVFQSRGRVPKQGCDHCVETRDVSHYKTQRRTDAAVISQIEEIQILVTARKGSMHK